ncbi:hypothetical protein LEP1GSC041_1507 [Leptospira noguchii str. 2006001870]|uniref:hypothetical protein n=1 Tax=Leptospira noguchii TaxID=28182 RepID=UPI0002489F1A|nr:hypothetical protein [Leptospira noguchii]EKR73287.1 hypothetical protein LEP1GSC041_1507 [Leptospira noguchii str. 2006001870]
MKKKCGIILYNLNIIPQKSLNYPSKGLQGIKECIKVTYPLICKRLSRMGAGNYFIDETGIRSDSTVGKTWRK